MNLFEREEEFTENDIVDWPEIDTSIEPHQEHQMKKEAHDERREATRKVKEHEKGLKQKRAQEKEEGKIGTLGKKTKNSFNPNLVDKKTTSRLVRRKTRQSLNNTITDKTDHILDHPLGGPNRGTNGSRLGAFKPY